MCALGARKMQKNHIAKATVGFLLLGGLSSFLLFGSPWKTTSVTTHAMNEAWITQSYGPLPHQVLDASLPVQLPAPAVILIHGGGWGGGTRTFLRPYADIFPNHAIFAISYTLGTPDTPSLDAALADIAQAIEYVKAHPAVDPEHVAILGHSAGGHIALLAAAHRTDIQAIVAVSAPLDLAAFDQSPVGAAVQNLLGSVYSPLELQTASPAATLDSATTHILIVQGANDPYVAPSAALNIAATNHSILYLQLPAGHAEPLSDPVANAAIRAFLDANQTPGERP